MTARTIAQSFGANAVLTPAATGGTLEIALDDLAALTGLNPAAPSPSQLVAALVILWGKSTNKDLEEDDATVGWLVEESYRSFTLRGEPAVRQEQIEYSISFFRQDSSTPLDPDEVI